MTVWRQLAEEATEHLSKGQAVVVSGEAYTNEWENRDGEKRSRIEVRGDAVGPDLRWPKPAQRSRSPQSGGDDPWTGGGQWQAGGQQQQPDEPPF